MIIKIINLLLYTYGLHLGATIFFTGLFILGFVIGYLFRGKKFD